MITRKEFYVNVFGHRTMKISHPVRSAVNKHRIDRLVLQWVTMWESRLLNSFFFFYAPILSFLRLFLDLSVRLKRSKCSKDVLIASNTPWSPRAVRWNQNRKKCAK